MGDVLAGLPLTSLQSVALTTVPLVLVWSYLRQYVNQARAFGWAEKILELHQFLVASASLVLAVYVLDIGHGLVRAKTGYQVDHYMLGYAYHILTIYDYLEIIFSVLAGHTQISKYTAFTHLFLPYWSFYRVIDRPHDSTDWRLQVIADCSVRFLSRAVPRLVEDLSTEELILSVCEEGRWYADIAICAFWAFFYVQDQRTSDQAIEVFGKPWDGEISSRVLSAGLLLYAGRLKRQEDTEKAKIALEKKEKDEPEPADIAAPSGQRSTRQRSHRHR